MTRAYTYEQATGNLLSPNIGLVVRGYAGRDEGKNNPDMQNVKGIPQNRFGLGLDLQDRQLLVRRLHAIRSKGTIRAARYVCQESRGQIDL